MYSDTVVWAEHTHAHYLSRSSGGLPSLDKSFEPSPLPRRLVLRRGINTLPTRP